MPLPAGSYRSIHGAPDQDTGVLLLSLGLLAVVGVFFYIGVRSKKAQAQVATQGLPRWYS